jgi:hypothetical protein
MQSSLFGSESEELVVRRLSRRLERYLKNWEESGEAVEPRSNRNLTQELRMPKPPPPVAMPIAVPVGKPKLSVVPPAPPIPRVAAEDLSVTAISLPIVEQIVVSASVEVPEAQVAPAQHVAQFSEQGSSFRSAPMSLSENIEGEKLLGKEKTPTTESSTILGMRPVFAYASVFFVALLIVLYFVLVSENFAY